MHQHSFLVDSTFSPKLTNQCCLPRLITVPLLVPLILAGEHLALCQALGPSADTPAEQHVTVQIVKKPTALARLVLVFANAISTTVIYQAVGKSMVKPLTSRLIYGGIQVSVRSCATGCSAERDSRARTSCRDICAHIPVRRDSLVRPATSVLCDQII